MHCADDVVQPASLGNIFLCDFLFKDLLYFYAYVFVCVYAT